MIKLLEFLVNLGKRDKSTHKRIYCIRGVYWYQTGLEYLEMLRVFKVAKKYYSNIVLDKQSLERLFEVMFNEGALQELFDLIVKPYEPNFWFKLHNNRIAKRKHIDRSHPIFSMRTTEIARIHGDFFIFYSRWTDGLMSFNAGLSSFQLQTLTNQN